MGIFPIFKQRLIREGDSEANICYDVITGDIRKSAASGVIRGAIGSSLLRPVGMLAGLSAKNKSIVTRAIHFKNGKNSLLELDEKVYKKFVQTMFLVLEKRAGISKKGSAGTLL